MDLEFKRRYDEIEFKYAHKLQAVGRRNGLKENSVVERIWLQKSLSHLPGFEKYSDQKTFGNVQVVINFDPKMLEKTMQRQQSVEAEIIKNDDLATV